MRFLQVVDAIGFLLFTSGLLAFSMSLFLSVSCIPVFFNKERYLQTLKSFYLALLPTTLGYFIIMLAGERSIWVLRKPLEILTSNLVPSDFYGVLIGMLVSNVVLGIFHIYSKMRKSGSSIEKPQD